MFNVQLSSFKAQAFVPFELGERLVIKMPLATIIHVHDRLRKHALTVSDGLSSSGLFAPALHQQPIARIKSRMSIAITSAAEGNESAGNR